MPLFLQVVDRRERRPTRGSCCCRCLLGIDGDARVSGRVISRTGRYKVFPVTGLALMSAALLLLSRMPSAPRRSTASRSPWSSASGSAWSRRSSPWRPELRRPPRPRHRDRVGEPVPLARRRSRRRGLRSALRRPARRRQRDAEPRLVDGVQTVFLVAAPVAALGALVVLFLQEVPLRQMKQPRGGPMASTVQHRVAAQRADRRRGSPRSRSPSRPAGTARRCIITTSTRRSTCSPGELTFQVGGDLVTAGPGALAFAPRGVHHTLANLSDGGRAICWSARRAASSAASTRSRPGPTRRRSASAPRSIRRATGSRSWPFRKGARTGPAAQRAEQRHRSRSSTASCRPVRRARTCTRTTSTRRSTWPMASSRSRWRTS